MRKAEYNSRFDMHVDLSRSFKRLMDGHCVYIDFCFDALFLTYIPLPVVLLTDFKGEQAVHVAPEAFKVAQAEFADELEYWQKSLPGKLNGQLESVRFLRYIFASRHSNRIFFSYPVQKSLPSTEKIHLWR